jgi:hypothetical protein
VERRNYAALAALVFPAAGLLMLAYSLAAWLRERRFPRLRFVPAGVPGVLGGRVAGRIEGEFDLPAGTEVNLALSCVRSYVSASGTRRSRWQRVLWQERKTAAAAGAPGHAAIPVDFAVPFDTRETDSRNPDDEILWRLSAEARLPGLDLRCAFQTPVFKTEASDPRVTVAALEAESRARHAGMRPAECGIAGGPGPSGGVCFYLPRARRKGAAAAATVFGLLCLGSGLFFGYAVGQGFSWFLGVIPLALFGGLGLLLLAVAWELWFRATTVESVNRELRVRHGYVLFSSFRVLRREDVRSFDLHCGMQQGDRVWYDLRARLANGRRFTVASGMEKNEAEWLLAEVSKDIGM